MHYSQDFDRLRIEVDTKVCDIPADERARMQAMLTSLDQAVKDFPSASLLIKVIYHPRSAVYHVEFKLKLPAKTMFAGMKVNLVHQYGLNDSDIAAVVP